MDLLRIFLENNLDLQVYISKWILLLAFFLAVLYIIFLRFFSGLRNKIYEIDEAEIGIGNQKIKIKPSRQDIQIAHKLWVELDTRKIGLTIDTKYDVINEIYDSWYKFFELTRELIKDIPASKIQRDKNTRRLIEIAINILNIELRPHLTKWQARFRKWYEEESKNQYNINLSPQEIQRKYPEYEEIIAEIIVVNKKLLEYKRVLKNIAIGT